MKKTELNEVKNMDIKALIERSRNLKKEVLDLVIDKNLGKIADLKSISKKRDELAQVLTVLRQKQILESVESK
jgi:ribosomal protein L29